MVLLKVEVKRTIQYIEVLRQGQKIIDQKNTSLVKEKKLFVRLGKGRLIS
jgi:hypothetical protein